MKTFKLFSENFKHLLYLFMHLEGAYMEQSDDSL